jgi:hypothetical protein
MLLISTLLIYVKQERFQQEYLGVKSLLSTYQKERPSRDEGHEVKHKLILVGLCHFIGNE